MRTHVQRAYRETSLLTFPNVRVHIRCEPRPTVISESGFNEGYTRAFLRSLPPDVVNVVRALVNTLSVRNWRAIRTNLLNLDVSNPNAVCAWLGAAGYAPQATLESSSNVYFTPGDVERMAAGNLGWRPEFVTAAIRQMLERYRDVFKWMMQVREDQFRECITAAQEFRQAYYETEQAKADAILSDKPRALHLKDPAKTFLEELGEPNLDADILGLALRGTSESEQLAAHLYWDAEGLPTVAAYAESPLMALCLSIHIDQHFSKRRPVQCPCGKWLDQIRGRDRFCSARCRNFYVTTDRRKRIGLIKEAAQDWTTLPPHKKSNRDRAEWIVSQVNKQSAGKYALEVPWVRKVLGDSLSKSRATQHKQVVQRERTERK